jgi:hypothetical protein
MGTPRFFFCIDVVVAVAVSERSAKASHPSYFYSEPIFVFSFLQTHPQQNMIASGSMDSDLTVKVWVDRGPT